ncbi:hypothetical protein [Mesorhizobium japonicum]|uniref:ATP-dependent DNA ligase n=1 Tax=Mesorhizobium TaxID=68287 RepID=UPI0031BA97B2
MGRRSQDVDGVSLYTRNGIDWTAKYRPLAEEAAAIEAESFIIEAEVIVTNEAGLSDFHALRSAITRRPQDLCLAAFDLLHLSGHNLRDMPLQDRREGRREAAPRVAKGFPPGTLNVFLA